MLRRTCQQFLSGSVPCQHFPSKSTEKLTTTAPPDSALRLEPGELVLWDGHVCRLESLTGARARICETIAAEIREVPVTELRGVPSLPTRQLDQRLETLRTVA